MRRASLLIAFALLLNITLAWMGPTSRNSRKAEDDFKLIQVADGVFAAVAKPGGLASGNAGFVVGDGGALMVDTFFTPPAVEELIGEIQKQTKQPIKYG